MTNLHPLAGVYPAAVTPLKGDSSLDLEAMPVLLDFLSQRGCHGALVLGTTGEGPSFSPQERLQILRAALQVRQVHPGMRLLAGTGTPSLDETIDLTRSAFELGFDGVVVLPPYYFRKVTEDGLFSWFCAVLSRAVPAGGILLGYHIPPVSGIHLSLDLLARLKDAYPTRFAGIKDSSGDAEFAHQLGVRFADELFVLTGNDRLFSLALAAHASGCITAMANLFSPETRLVWDAYLSGQADLDAQNFLTAARMVLDRYAPMPPLVKALLSRLHPFPLWPVRLPLLSIPDQVVSSSLDELAAIR